MTDCIINKMEESKEAVHHHPPLLPPLKLFETSLVVAFLSSSIKIVLMSALSRGWNAFIYHPYAWHNSIQPISSTAADVYPYFQFLSRFSSFEGLSLTLRWGWNIGFDHVPSYLSASDIHLTNIDVSSFEKLISLHSSVA